MKNVLLYWAILIIILIGTAFCTPNAIRDA